MSTVYLFGADQEINRSEQVVTVNQVIQMNGYSCDWYVVYDISKSDWGLAYKLINLRTKEFYTTDIVRPLSKKFGIGYYYDDTNPTFMDVSEVKVLLQEATTQAKAKAEELDKEQNRIEEVKNIGRKRFTELLPDDTQAIIVARLKQNDSDSQTDYFATSIQRTVILGFSPHKRNLFAEMRKYASNFEHTAYLSELNKDFEHRENYSMGEGYYLGESKYYGWIIEKVPIYNRNRKIEDFAITAGDENNLHIKQMNTLTITTNESMNYILVEYSEKAMAVFGDTKAIKEELKALGGRFNRTLTHEGTKQAGWIFPKKAKEKLQTLLNK